MTVADFCAGEGCPRRRKCARYLQHHWLPMATKHRWGVGAGPCRDFKVKT